MHILAVAEQAEGQQLGLLPVGGGHVVFAMSVLEGLADPDSPQLADQGVLPCQPALVVLHYDADDLSGGEEEEGKGHVVFRLGFSRVTSDLTRRGCVISVCKGI